MTRIDRDFYPTPHSIINVLVAKLTWEKQVIWEPCAGDGRLAKVFNGLGHQTISHDIQTGHDFFDWKQAQAQALVTNPPFRQIREFIDHAFSIGVKRMALICNERLWACGKGFDQWQRHRPSCFVNLSWREDYLNKGGSPDRALAISIWETPHAQTCSYEIWSRATQ
tara:strand:+ start:526 stop:1026 length:501 start_codon:yes stop_codon:yes gene_type:complete